ncbi:MAG TPA: hypothetical protein VGM39_03180 [Kofleriaceae bacterium]
MSSREQVEDDVLSILRLLCEQTEALRASIVRETDTRTGIPARTFPLGDDGFLRIELGARSSSDPNVESFISTATKRLAVIGREVRRRAELAGSPLEGPQLPELVYSTTSGPTIGKVTERIESYLKALATIDRATNAFVIKAGKGGAAAKLVASATAPDEQEASRWQFLARRVFNTHAPGSSHGEIVDPDAYAMTFWYDCALLVFLAEPFGEDFVRHRCKQVARELSNLLPMLDPDPDAPAAIRRRPPTIP